MNRWQILILIFTTAIAGWFSLASPDVSLVLTNAGVEVASRSNTALHVVASMAVIAIGFYLIYRVRSTNDARPINRA